MRKMFTATTAAVALAVFMSSDITPVRAQDYATIVAQPDRTDADRQTDKRRDPVNLLTFTGAKAGWTVLDMGAGAGYSTELMARSVGPTGKVYGQNDKDSEKLQARMTTPVMRNVVALVRRPMIRSPRICTTSISSPFSSPIMTRPIWRSIVSRWTRPCSPR